MPNSDTDLLPLARRAVSVLAEPPPIEERNDHLMFGDAVALRHSPTGFYTASKRIQFPDGETIWLDVHTGTVAALVVAAAVAELARRAALRAMEETDA